MKGSGQAGAAEKARGGPKRRAGSRVRFSDGLSAPPPPKRRGTGKGSLSSVGQPRPSNRSVENKKRKSGRREFVRSDFHPLEIPGLGSFG